MKAVYWALALVLLIGCVNYTLPDNVMSREQMAEVLLDIYLAEAKIASGGKRDFSATEIYPFFHEKILERNQITDSVYQANISYYLSNPRLIEEVFNMMIDSLTVRQQRLSTDEIEPMDQPDN
ncbi:MAG: DUF4296 domain-containing protein [Cyclobacteriaceae bacterium]|nr:DUF4296 domain-containing protein [Cyclobacteriaceae bacterium]